MRTMATLPTPAATAVAIAAMVLPGPPMCWQLGNKSVNANSLARGFALVRDRSKRDRQHLLVVSPPGGSVVQRQRRQARRGASPGGTGSTARPTSPQWANLPDDARFNFSNPVDQGGRTPLHEAVRKGDPEEVEALVNAGANFHASGKTGGLHLQLHKPWNAGA
ncbi:MAG: ankyrin repeat domain-containing protein [Synechococcus sp. SB0668_bin_15]|nr:ankyrin repeat domain-containing protein [Synechococcus sp. SB0668_bin_15]MXZ82609.1 ankyrin repeat domain-containing protein [Synechococcus sp. SB0666_bin_14]MYA90476.1 ankyrin repeat domain-containing protein [Synechococcus sp. SB0663_bin_10]MYC49369.1 ankyrin repeat domain-containing protein [Synechococcus sp. SB0662_bin_14]MYG47241.1 ankyrin repeat domain-containing protein [Synechococcus sp. SB0675_bin_6]MYJ60681.1 ankyrin repeat domain-containing protein [Synechococcus sp. SB0672_bin_